MRGGFRCRWLAWLTNGRVGLGTWTLKEIEAINARANYKAAAILRIIADSEHEWTERADAFGGYLCSCGESWLEPMYAKGCHERQKMHDRADALEKGER